MCSSGHATPIAMDAVSTSPPPLRIVIFPWLGFGHMLPCLELAERLASRGHRVSFVSTRGNIARLPAPRPAAAPRVDFVALPLPPVDGLPDGVESTNTVSRDKFHLLFRAFDGLADRFAEFLGAACADEANRPDWVIVDLFHYWAAAAAEHKVPCMMLVATSAACMVAVRDSRSSRANTTAADEPPASAAVPRYELEMNTKYFTMPVAAGMSISERIALTCRKSTLTALRSCLELEPEVLPLVAPFLRKPVIPLGLHPPSPDDGGHGASMNRGHGAVRWLHAQPPGSVVYVALGSEVPVPAEMVHELALGLELARTRFVWALRKPSGVADADVLPPGFQERTGGHGFVATGWVPQTAILAHRAVGGFLTHCGWSSLIEGLLHGRPLIMLPIFGDQGPNARLMERKKVGLQVRRDESDGSFDRHGVASAVRAVMVEEETRGIFVANVQKVQEMVADKELHERYIDEFIQQLRSYGAVSNSTTVAAAPPAVA